MPSQAPGRHRLISGPLRCAIRAKTVAAQNRPARRRLEGHGISLAALVARDLESLAFTTWLCSSATAEVGPPRIAARLTAFWMSKITFLVILLFAFSKCEWSAALRTRDFEVWHRGFSMKAESRNSTLFALRSAGVAFLSSTRLWSESAVSQTLRRKASRPDG